MRDAFSDNGESVDRESRFRGSKVAAVAGTTVDRFHATAGWTALLRLPALEDRDDHGLEDELTAALRREYKLGSSAGKARLSAVTARRRARLSGWVDEQVRGLPKAKAKDDPGARFWARIVGEAAYTWLNRLVVLRLLEGHGLRALPVPPPGLRPASLRRCPPS